MDKPKQIDVDFYKEKAQAVLSDILFKIEYLEDEVKRPKVEDYKSFLTHAYRQIVMAKTLLRECDYLQTLAEGEE